MTTGVSDRRQLLIQIARLYFLEGLNQEAVAARVGVSRSNVSRLLKVCREQNIVEIHVHDHGSSAEELAAGLRERFGLRFAVTVSADPHSAPTAAAGKAAADLVESELRDGMTLGLSWGRGVYHTVSAWRSGRVRGVDVVQLMGGLGTGDLVSDGSELARRLAEQLGGRCYLLHAPLFLQSEATRRALLREPEIRSVLARARNADIAVVGIGTNKPGLDALVRAGHLTERQSAGLRRQGVVGNVLGLLIDIRGEVCPIPLNRRVMALDARALRKIPLVVGVATGVEKSEALLGALRGRLVSALVTDERTARRILQAERQQ